MKVIKPQRLSALTRVLESGDRFYFIVTILAGFPFASPRSLMPEIALWPFVQAGLGEGAVLDEGMSKARGEVFVHGQCFVPGGVPRPVSYVRVQVGKVDKRIAVVGDRVWRHGVSSEPVPFTVMPIDWAHAFGGPGHAANPLGKGYAPIRSESGAEVHELPNLEYERCLLRSPRDRPPPAAFGAIDPTWAQRAAKVGTYDKAWLETRFPGIAADLDATYFNTASEDQWVDGYFEGAESFVIEHMHPTRPRLEGRLPGLSTRAFIMQRGSDGQDTLREIRMRLDTVHLFPETEKGVVVYRGMIEIAEDDGDDVRELLVAAEDPASPREVDHYRRVLDERRDKDKAALAFLKDADLMPPAVAGWSVQADRSDIEEMITGERLLEKRMRRRQQVQWGKARERLLAHGMDPAQFGMTDLPPDEEPPGIDDPDALAAFVDRQQARADELQAEAQRKKLEMEQKGRELCAQQGLDFDKMMADARKASSGPPQPFAARYLDSMRTLVGIARDGGQPMPELEALLTDPGHEASVREREAKLFEAYRQFAHHAPAASAPEADQAALLRALVVTAREAQERLAGRDLTGADLSQLDLSGIDLSGAFLEGASFVGADLRSAKLDEAVLARADLTGANLTDASLRGANLGSANLASTDFTRADLRRAVLAKAKLEQTCMRGAQLEEADFLEAAIGAVDLFEASAPGVFLLRADLTRARLAGADLTRAVLLETNLTGVDLAGVKLTSAQLIGCNADGASFSVAGMSHAVVIHGSSLVGANFAGATLDAANFRGTPMTRCNLAGASLVGANLSGCDLREADLCRALLRDAVLLRTDFRGARLVGANLMGAIMGKARLGGADLRGSNLFRADLCRVEVDADTNLTDALTTQARVVARRPHGSA